MHHDLSSGGVTTTTPHLDRLIPPGWRHGGARQGLLSVGCFMQNDPH